MQNKDIVIRPAQPDEWETAMELAWLTFLKFEAPVYGHDGTESFLNFISGEQLYKMFLNGDYRMAVAFKGKEMVGMSTLRSGTHISLLFVKEEYHRLGIGRALLASLQQENMKRGQVKLTVNASPYGVPFYKKLGFIETDSEQHADGITYLPMVCVSAIETS